MGVSELSSYSCLLFSETIASLELMHFDAPPTNFLHFCHSYFLGHSPSFTKDWKSASFKLVILRSMYWPHVWCSSYHFHANTPKSFAFPLFYTLKKSHPLLNQLSMFTDYRKKIYTHITCDWTYYKNHEPSPQTGIQNCPEILWLEGSLLPFLG